MGVSEAEDRVQARRGPLIATGVLAVLGVLVASTIGVLLSGIGCLDPQRASYIEYCSESHVVGAGGRVTFGVLGPPMVTAVAAVTSVRRRSYKTLVLVAVAMLLAGVALPTLLWEVDWSKWDEVN
jgi:hypothetical protein